MRIRTERTLNTQRPLAGTRIKVSGGSYYKGENTPVIGTVISISGGNVKVEFDEHHQPNGKLYSKKVTAIRLYNVTILEDVPASPVFAQAVTDDGSFASGNYSLPSRVTPASRTNRVNLSFVEELTLNQVDITDDVKSKIRELCLALKRNGFEKKTTEMLLLLNMGMKELEEYSSI